MKHGTYIGHDPAFKDQCALIRDDPESRSSGVLVQFDDIKNLPLQYTHGWCSFYASEFKYDPPYEGE